MTSSSGGLHVQDASFLSQIEGLTGFIQELTGPGAVRVLFSDAGEPLSCSCLSQSLESLLTGFSRPAGFQISPVPSCPMLLRGMWSVLSQRGEALQGQGDVLCLATSIDGVGALAIQVEVLHFARRDFRYRRLLCGGLLFGLCVAGSLLGHRRLLAQVAQGEERVGNLIRSQALARDAERERLSLQLHDGVIQCLVAVTHMVEALREMPPAQPEKAALLQRAEELLRQSIQEARGIINALHTPASRTGNEG